MKKTALISLITIVFIGNLVSQSPNLMSYQAVIWDASGNLVSEKMVSIKISILQSSISGSSVYSENHRVQTNINGLVSLMIGGGTNATGKISDINWGGGSYFLKTETDPTGGVNFSITGTTQLVSVPYSMFSGLAGNISTKNIGSPGQTLTIDKDGKMTWVSNLPTISTNVITDIKPNSSVSGGSIASDGGSPVTSRGVVWSINPNPTVSLSTKTSDGLGMGNFTSNLTGLSSNTTYYVRAYATNSVGTSYGNEIIFTTLVNLPILSTTPISALTSTTAMSGGNITADGGSSVTSRGVVWGTSPNPTISLSTKTNDGTGIGSYSSSVSGLTANTIYYIRSYATNIAGTGYGNEISFITLDSTIVMGIPCPGTPTLKDIDGNTYNTVQIGTQCWTKENLRVTKYRDGTVIPLDESGGTNGNGTSQTWGGRTTGARTVNGNNTVNLVTYGYLYNLYATVDSKGICPKGWHIPSDTEWTTLTDYLEGLGVAGGKIKLTGTTYWIYPNSGATNESGFSALPGGYRYSDGFFSDTGLNTIFWSDAKLGSNSSWGRAVHKDYNYVSRIYYNGSLGHSVRCLKDTNVIVSAPSLTTTAITAITTTSATSGGNITADGGATITARGVVWSTTTNPNIALSTKTIDGTGTGSFSSTLTNLTPKTTYYIRAYATNSAGTGYGNEITFTTLDSSNVMGVPCPGTPTVKDIDGNTYNTVQVGTQCWTKENLKVTKYRDGSGIPLDTSGGVNGNGTGQTWSTRTTGARTAFEHNKNNLEVYGYLYNWYAVADNKGLCPSGWHVPSDTEWTTLINYLGGDNVAGGKMKTTGTTYWKSPNNGATNESGFSGLPSGIRTENFDREPNNGFGFIGYYAFFWSSNETNTCCSYYFQLFYDLSIASKTNIYFGTKKVGASIRCVRD